MDAEIRTLAPSELADFIRTVEVAFGHHADEGDIAEEAAITEVDRGLAAVSGGRLVGTAAALSLELTVPGPVAVATAGVTAVGVLPTHRRRGILTALMARQLDDIAARGEPLAALLAAEGGIYRRYGYGPAVFGLGVEISRERGAFDRHDRAVPDGSMRLLGPEEAVLLLPEVFEHYRRSRPGEVCRTEGIWESIFADRERWREGAGALFFAVHDEPDGEVSGYTAYRVREQWPNGLPALDLEVVEVVAVTPAAFEAVWRFVLDIDLVRTVTVANMAVDSPLRWLLADARQLRATQLIDVLWVRILDVAAALAARRYQTGGRVVIEVVDPFRPASGGRFELVAEAGGPGTCRRTDDLADLALPTDVLASAYLGGVSWASLAAAGRAGELAAGALARAHAMFATPHAPTCITDF